MTTEDQPKLDADRFVDTIVHAEIEVEFHNEAFRGELVALLQKYELPALVAVDRLNAFCREILCHFNTRSLEPFSYPHEVKIRADVEKKEALQETSWRDVLRAGELHQDIGAQFNGDG